MIHYNKLIRDRVPEIKQQQGKKISYHDAKSDEEYWYALRTKLQEEIDEFITNQDTTSLADVYDVLDAMRDFKKFDPKEFMAVRENKNIELGGFAKRWILEGSEEEIGHRQEQGI